MRVLLAHALTPKRRRIARVLEAAGHEVIEVDDPSEALARCRTWAPTSRWSTPSAAATSCVEIKSDPVAYGTAILMIERPDLSPDAGARGDAARRPGLSGGAGRRRRGA